MVVPSVCPLVTAVRLALMLHVWAKAENLRYPTLFSKGKNKSLKNNKKHIFIRILNEDFYL